MLSQNHLERNVLKMNIWIKELLRSLDAQVDEETRKEVMESIGEKYGWIKSYRIKELNDQS